MSVDYQFNYNEFSLPLSLESTNSHEWKNKQANKAFECLETDEIFSGLKIFIRNLLASNFKEGECFYNYLAASLFMISI